MTKTEYLTSQLEKALRRSSKGKMPKSDREFLAKRTIGRLDVTNNFQMHKSIEGYAQMLVEKYFNKI